MIAEIALIKNWKERNRADDMNMDLPDEVFEYMPFGFSLDDVKMFHLDKDNQIALFFSGDKYWIKYNKSIYDQLMKRFE
jgi:hypothetical protein